MKEDEYRKQCSEISKGVLAELKLETNSNQRVINRYKLPHRMYLGSFTPRYFILINIIHRSRERMHNGKYLSASGNSGERML
jgi:hypothetical protein